MKWYHAALLAVGIGAFSSCATVDLPSMVRQKIPCQKEYALDQEEYVDRHNWQYDKNIFTCVDPNKYHCEKFQKRGSTGKVRFATLDVTICDRDGDGQVDYLVDFLSDDIYPVMNLSPLQGKKCKLGLYDKFRKSSKTCKLTSKEWESAQNAFDGKASFLGL